MGATHTASDRPASDRDQPANNDPANNDPANNQPADHDPADRRRGEARVYAAERQDKPWGYELIFASGADGYVGKIIHVRAGESLSLQYHRAKAETITVTAGVARFEYGADEHDLHTVDLRPGDVIHLPAGVRHRIAAVEDVTLVEASTAAPGWREDVVRLEDRYGRTGTSAP